MRRDVSGPGWVRAEDRAGIDGPVRLYRVPEAMALLSLSRSVLYEQIAPAG